MLTLQREGAVARLLINRPERANAMNLAMWQAVPTLLAEAEADGAVRGGAWFGHARPVLRWCRHCRNGRAR
jgi:enoyl-CoA hydratase/carnithine racemase